MINNCDKRNLLLDFIIMILNIVKKLFISVFITLNEKSI